LHVLISLSLTNLKASRRAGSTFFPWLPESSAKQGREYAQARINRKAHGDGDRSQTRQQQERECA
jgi:hypothetical protein